MSWPMLLSELAFVIAILLLCCPVWLGQWWLGQWSLQQRRAARLRDGGC